MCKSSTECLCFSSRFFVVSVQFCVQFSQISGFSSEKWCRLSATTSIQQLVLPHNSFSTSLRHVGNIGAKQTKIYNDADERTGGLISEQIYNYRCPPTTGILRNKKTSPLNSRRKQHPEISQKKRTNCRHVEGMCWTHVEICRTNF